MSHDILLPVSIPFFLPRYQRIVSEAIVSLHGEGTLPFLEAHSQKKKKRMISSLNVSVDIHRTCLPWYLGGDKSGRLGYS